MTNSADKLAGKTAVVTGAAQSIGLAVARRLQADGAEVIAADLNPPPEDAGLAYQHCDVSDEESVAALFAAVLKRGEGKLHILVNNAGVGLESALAKTALADWERVFSVNVRGVFLCSKHAFAPLAASGGGSIVNIGSIEGNGANPLHAAYAASKGAVHALTRNIALEYGAHKIRCNAIAPGWIDTPFNEQLIAQYADPAAARRAIERLHPVRRMGGAEEIAALAAFLGADESAFISGQVVVIDGGRTACLPLPPL